MNTRLLGTLCMIGSAVFMLDGVLKAVLGDEGGINPVTILVWAIGGLCGILALVALRATGTNPILRLISYVPALGFLFLIVGPILRLTNVFPQPSINWVAGIGWLLVMSGMLIVGILALAAKTWTGWRKITPSLPILMVFVGAIGQNVMGWSGSAAYVVTGAGFLLMGYGIASSNPVPSLRQAAA